MNFFTQNEQNLTLGEFEQTNSSFFILTKLKRGFTYYCLSLKQYSESDPSELW